MSSSKSVRRALCLLSAAVVATLGQNTRVSANSELDVNNGATDLTSSSSYLQGTAPAPTSDVTFTNITYNPTAFTVNSSLSVGTLNDLDTTQSLSISNAGAAATTLTLNGGTNSVAPGNGGNASDLLYVASGGTLTLTGGSGT